MRFAAYTPTPAKPTRMLNKLFPFDVLLHLIIKVVMSRINKIGFTKVPGFPYAFDSCGNLYTKGITAYIRKVNA